MLVATREHPRNATPCVFKASSVIVTVSRAHTIQLFFSKMLFHFRVYGERPGGRQKVVALEKLLCLASFKAAQFNILERHS